MIAHDSLRTRRIGKRGGKSENVVQEHFGRRPARQVARKRARPGTVLAAAHRQFPFERRANRHRLSSCRRPRDFVRRLND